MSAAAIPELEWLETVDSSNDEIRRRFLAETPLEQFATVATTNQTAGRGRLDRSWVDTPGASLAMSSYLTFSAEVARGSIGWVTLSAGLAVREALAELCAPEQEPRLQLKWPNDVLIDGRKVVGILGEVLGVLDGGERFACVVGTGINLHERAAITAAASDAAVGRTRDMSRELPTAASIAELGVTASAEQLATAYLRALGERITALIAHRGNARASGLVAELETRLDTLGQRVRVSRLDGGELIGEATGLRDSGELVITDDSGREHSVRVGDVQHLRGVRSAE